MIVSAREHTMSAQALVLDINMRLLSLLALTMHCVYTACYAVVCRQLLSTLIHPT
jgi:hypothetical protein